MEGLLSDPMTYHKLVQCSFLERYDPRSPPISKQLLAAILPPRLTSWFPKLALGFHNQNGPYILYSPKTPIQDRHRNTQTTFSTVLLHYYIGPSLRGTAAPFRVLASINSRLHFSLSLRVFSA